MSYPGGNGWPEQPQQPQPYLKTYPQPYQQPYEQSELYQPYQQYQQYGGYPGGPPPPKKSRTGFWIGIGALVLVIAVGVTLLIVLTGKNKVDQQAAARATSAPGGPQSPPPASTSAPSSTIQPSIAGWQGVAASGENVAYDVPPNWKVETSDTLTGFENASLPLATMHSVATYEADEGCPGSPRGSYRTHTGMMQLVNIDPQKAAIAANTLRANAALEKPAEDTTLPRPTASPTKISNGALDAWTASTTITPLPDQCSAPSMKFTTVAFVPPGQQQTALFVMYGDQQIADALQDAVANQIIGTLRPYSP